MITKPKDTAQLVERLRIVKTRYNMEEGHIAADQALLDFIDDPEVAQAFENIDKWYA